MLSETLVKVHPVRYLMPMDRKPFTTTIETGRLKEIKKLAIDLERPVNTLLEEAIDYLVAKYKPKARPAK